jgi:hypothetical protein
MGFVRGFWSDIRVQHFARTGGWQIKTAKMQSAEISAEHFDNRCFILRVYLDSFIAVKRDLAGPKGAGSPKTKVQRPKPKDQN